MIIKNATKSLKNVMIGSHTKNILKRGKLLLFQKLFRFILPNKGAFSLYHRDSLYGSIRYHLSEQKTINKQSSEKTSLLKIKEMIKADLQDNYSSCTNIKRIFAQFINGSNHKAINQMELMEVLSLLSHYPSFPLDNSTMLTIYKVVCFNLHLKTVQTMNQLLSFVLVADSQASQSPIFHEFIRFYLQLSLELFKFKYQLDFANMSFTQAIRQFFGKLAHRGFLSRTPPYERNLNILEPRRILLLLRKNPSVESTLMIKKLNYTIFLEIKEYYEQEMKENLYHPKKIYLLQLFTKHYLQVLSQEIEMTQHQAVHLRELYMKLYLTLPEQENSNAELQKFKFKQVIYMYGLAAKHIQRLDHLKLDQINEKIDVVIEFVQFVDHNMAKLLDFTQQQLIDLQLQFQEVLQIILWAKKTGQPSNKAQGLFALIKPKINSYTLWHYFSSLIDVLKYLASDHLLSEITNNEENYHEITLSQLPILLELFLVKESQEYSLSVSNVLKKVLSTDFQIIGGQEITYFLRIYHCCIISGANRDFDTNAEALRVFVMRYIADHHKQFAIRELQQILELIMRLPHEKCTNFNDEQGNYPSSVFQEMASYISKVSLLFSAQTKQKLATEQRLKRAE